MTTTRETEISQAFDIEGTVAPAGHGERSRESMSVVCPWAPGRMETMTVVETDAALAADPLFHLRADGHRGRIELHHWYFRPELKYSTCRPCSDAGDPSVLAPADVGCQHRIAALAGSRARVASSRG